MRERDKDKECIFSAYIELRPGLRNSMAAPAVPDAAPAAPGKNAEVILFPFQAQGHTIPALVLATRLVECGANVTFVTFKDRLQRVNEALQVLNRCQACPSTINVVALVEGVREAPEEWNKSGHDTTDSILIMIAQAEDAKPGFQNLVKQVLLSKSPQSRCCIVSDTLLSWTQDVANSLGVPRYIIYPSPATVLAGVFFVAAIRPQLPLKLGDGDDDEQVNIPGGVLPAIRTRDMHSFLLETASAVGHSFYVDNCLRVHESAGVLINTFQDIDDIGLRAVESRAINPNRVPVFPVGPLLLPPCAGGGEEYLEWLSSKPPSSVLYVSFGSILILSAEENVEVAKGLEASGVDFLWVMRSGDATPPPLHTGKVVTAWVPQPDILAHPSTAAFLTHCGWNSTLEGLCNGVPLVAMPAFSDQALNTRLVERLGVGVEAKKGKNGMVERRQVEAAVRAVVGNQGMRAKARDIASKARRARESSAGVLDHFLSS